MKERSKRKEEIKEESKIKEEIKEGSKIKEEIKKKKGKTKKQISLLYSIVK